MDRRLKTNHIPLVDADAGHPLPWAELPHEPFDPEPEVDDDHDVEAGEEKPKQVELVRLALIEGAAAPAYA